MISDWIISQSQKKFESVDLQRGEVGRLTSFVGILINIGLSIIKMTAGWLFDSVAILADGVNNLSDAGNALILMVSFKLSSKPADEEHPYGHERYEYLASLVVGVSILLLSVELLKSSFNKIVNPDNVDYSILMIVVLVISIIGKIWLYAFYKKCAHKIDSTVLLASAQDSINDVLSTSAVFISTLIYYFFQLNLDGVMGILVASIILISGINILKEAANKILGEAPDADFVRDIEKKIMQFSGVCGIHDLMVHNYGPNRCFVSVHVEVDSREDILISHDRIDSIEQYFLREEHIQMVIHMDPIVLNNPLINKLHDEIKHCVKALSSDITIHDFRAVLGTSHSKLIFDCVIPYSCPISQQDVQKAIDEMLSKKEETYYTAITFERPFVR